MQYVGVDLHKKSISACVVVKECERRQVTARKRLECKDESAMAAWFRELGPFEVVVEATSSYQPQMGPAVYPSGSPGGREEGDRGNRPSAGGRDLCAAAGREAILSGAG
jgi:hypothetical protein